jgi:hypothetical protein
MDDAQFLATVSNDAEPALEDAKRHITELRIEISHQINANRPQFDKSKSLQARLAIERLSMILEDIHRQGYNQDKLQILELEEQTLKEKLREAKSKGESTLNAEIENYKRTIHQQELLESQKGLVETLEKLVQRTEKLVERQKVVQERLVELRDEEASLKQRRENAKKDKQQALKQLDGVKNVDEVQRARQQCVELAKEIQALRAYLESRIK